MRLFGKSKMHLTLLRYLFCGKNVVQLNVLKCSLRQSYLLFFFFIVLFFLKKFFITVSIPFT